jgi:radical SAM protein with 4Fe4S-binding SPASM domain
MKKIARHIRSFFRILRKMLIDGLVRQGYRTEMPSTIIIEPTNICNLKCACCPQGNTLKAGRTQGFMSRETFLQALNNIDVPVKEICLYLHGEPLLNKNLDFFVSQIDKLKKVMATIYSNGYNINVELLKKILAYKKVRFSFSMDIFSKEIYEQIRTPARYENALASLSAIDEVFAEYHRKYELTMIADKDTDEQELCNRLFARYRQLKKVSFGSKFPWPEDFQTGNLEGRMAKKRRACKQITGGVAVFWTGEVTLCSYDFSGKLVIGNLWDGTLSKIYNSQRARAIRKRHFFHQWHKIPVCKNCLLPRFTSKTTSFNRPKENEKTGRN